MRKQRAGSVVNVSSVSSLRPEAKWGAYNAANAGAIAMTKAMDGEEGAYGIRANVICRGIGNVTPLASRRTGLRDRIPAAR